MGKIKGWKKTGRFYYRRINDNVLLQIGKESLGKWKVYVQEPKQKMRVIHIGFFHTDVGARKFAIKSMRLHPNG